MKNKLIKFFLIFGLIIIPLTALKATNDTSNETLFVAKDEIISGNLIAAGESIIVDGTVSGDLIVAAQSLVVTGRIEGDILALSQEIEIKGEVGGNVRVFGDSVNIDSNITRNLNAIGSNVTIGENTRVGWDVLTVSVSSARIRGNIYGSLSAYGQKIFLAGKIGKNADIKNYGQNQGLTIAKDTVINGDLNYSAKLPADIADGANISGQINYQEIQEEEKTSFSTWAWNRLFSILSMILIGLVLIFLMPKYLKEINHHLKKQSGKIALIGAGLLLIIPPLAIILLFTIIGIPLALALFSLWLAGLFFAKTIISIALGEMLIKDLFKKQTVHIFWSLILGAFILSLIFSIPFVGWFIRLVAIAFGLGSIVLYVTHKCKNI